MSTVIVFETYNFSAKPIGESIQLSWQPPLAANGKVTGYLIKYRKQVGIDEEIETEWQLKTVLGDALTCPIRNAEPETEYRFVISAKNSKGTGPESTQLIFITPSVANKACFLQFSHVSHHLMLGDHSSLNIIEKHQKDENYSVYLVHNHCRNCHYYSYCNWRDYIPGSKQQSPEE